MIWISKHGKIVTFERKTDMTQQTSKHTWRPSEYTERHIELAKEYLESCKDTYTEKDKLKVKLPSIEWLARHMQKAWLHIARSTIYEWKEDGNHKEFSDILEHILAEQAERLINSSISGEYNSNIAKLLMWKHWYTDKIETKNENTWEITIKIVE